MHDIKKEMLELKDEMLVMRKEILEIKQNRESFEGSNLVLGRRYVEDIEPAQTKSFQLDLNYYFSLEGCQSLDKKEFNGVQFRLSIDGIPQIPEDSLVIKINDEYLGDKNGKMVALNERKTGMMSFYDLENLDTKPHKIDLTILHWGKDYALEKRLEKYATKTELESVETNVKSAAQSYAATAEANAINAAQGYAATAETNAINAAQGYAATAEANAQNAAQSYATTAETNAKSAAQGYAATAETNAQNVAHGYATAGENNAKTAAQGFATVAKNEVLEVVKIYSDLADERAKGYAVEAEANAKTITWRAALFATGAQPGPLESVKIVGVRTVKDLQTGDFLWFIIQRPDGRIEKIGHVSPRFPDL